MTLATNVLHIIAMVMLAVSAVLAMRRLAAGPTSLDRSVASDVMIAVLIASVGLYMVWTEDAVGLPILVGLSLLGFTAAVAMARLISNRSDQIQMLHDVRNRSGATDVDSRVDAWEEEGSDGSSH